jgi:hypothetical protein
MQGLAGVFLEVGAGQLHHSLVLTQRDRQLAANDHRQFVLADLVTLGKVRVEVVLARENRSRGDLCADRQAEADCAFDGALVEHRQHARQGDIDGIGLDIGLGAKGRRAARENLRLRRQLRVRLDADDHFPCFHHCLLTLQ